MHSDFIGHALQLGITFVQKTCGLQDLVQMSTDMYLAEKYHNEKVCLLGAPFQMLSSDNVTRTYKNKSTKMISTCLYDIIND